MCKLLKGAGTRLKEEQTNYIKDVVGLRFF